MEIPKLAHELYQLFAGIHEKKLFLQIVDRKGNIKYAFESKELDTTSDRTLCGDIMNACYEFFNPAAFKFDDDFVLSREFPLLIRRYGQKIISTEANKVI